MLNAGQVLMSEMLITAVWGNEGGDKTMLKQLVYHLRAKLEETGTAVQIETTPGVGYSLRQE
jgi:two-component system response regulator MtrA